MPPAEALARVFLKAVQSNRAFPRDVRLRSQKHAASLGPLMESFGVKLRVANRLPSAEEACASTRLYGWEAITRGLNLKAAISRAGSFDLTTTNNPSVNSRMLRLGVHMLSMEYRGAKRKDRRLFGAQLDQILDHVS